MKSEQTKNVLYAAAVGALCAVYLGGWPGILLSFGIILAVNLLAAMWEVISS